MPEGPEMVWLKEQASPFIGEQVVQAQGNTGGHLLHQVQGKMLEAIFTHGKEMYLSFPGFFIRIHLGFFGAYCINTTLPRKLELELEFETGVLRFYATNCSMVLHLPRHLYLSTADVLDDLFDPVAATAALARKPFRIIADALLDQEALAGMGNGLKNEVLYRQRVNPLSVVGEIPPAVLQSLVRACVQQSNAYLEHLREGRLPEYWQVYRKKECLRDGLPLRREKLGKTNRSCYYCEHCQQLYAGEEGW